MLGSSIRQAKEQSGTFRIRLSIRKNEEVELSVLEPHTCPTSVRPLSMKHLLFLSNYVLWGLLERRKKCGGWGPGVSGPPAGQEIAN